MKNKFILALFFITIMTTTSQEWFPYLWSKLHSTNNVSYIGKLEKVLNKCSGDKSLLKCRGTYQINRTGGLGNSNLSGVLGLGFFLTDYSLLCNDREIYRSFTSNGYSLNFDSYKIYKTINLKGLKCKNGSKLFINAYTYQGLKTYGQISKNAIWGKPEYISSIKRAIEFLSTGIYLVCGILLLFIYFVKYFVLRAFKKNYKDESPSFYINNGKIILFFAAFSLFKSGIVDIIASSPTSVDILFRVQTFTSLVIHTYLPILLVSKNDNKKIKYLAYALLIIYLPLSFTNIFNFYLVYSAKSIAIITLVLSLYRKKYSAMMFSFFVLVETSKVFNFSFLPPGSTTLIYATLFYSKDFFHFLNVAGIYANANLWYRKYSVSINTFTDLLPFFKSFASEIGVKRVTVFFLGKNDEHVVWTYDETFRDVESVPLNYVPGSFAQVISSNIALFHQDVDSDFSKNLLKKDDDNSLGKYYSIIPLKSQGRIKGVVSLSKYNFERDDIDKNYNINLDTMVSVFSEIISIISNKIGENSKDEMLSNIYRVVNDYKESSQSKSYSDIGDSLLEKINKNLGWKGFFGVLSEDQIDLEIISSTYDDDQGGVFLKGQTWAMLKENVRAPAPLALHYGQTVFMPNVKWIDENISENTKLLFKETNMKSFVAIPLKRKTNDGLRSIALLWLSSDIIGEFDNSFERCSILIQELLEHDIQRMINFSISENVFSSVIREDIKNQLVKGYVPVEKGVGTLLMIDLVGSSKISKELGADKWKEYQNEFFSSINNIASQFDLLAETFVWDAINFTSNGVVEELSLLNLTKLCIQKVNDINLDFNVSHFADELKPIRLCATYGDITREVFNGAWDITGHAMARVCKQEQFIKKTDIVLSITEELFNRINIKNLKLSEVENDFHKAGLDISEIQSFLIKEDKVA